MIAGFITTFARTRCVPVPAYALATLLTLTLPWSGVAFADEAPVALQVSGAWVRAMPPGQRMTAAYLSITNLGSTAVTLGEVTCERGQASLHETRVVDGRSSMRPVAQLEIQPGDSVSLQPGGLHIMLMGLPATPAEGEALRLCLNFSSGNTCVDAPVLRSPDSLPTAEHHSH